MDDTNVTFAIVYILYGLFKIITGIILLYLPLNYIKKIPILKNFIGFANDRTLAGMFYDYILIAFGIYTIICGLVILDVFSKPINTFFDNKITIYIIYYIFGITTLVFYLLVLYTDAPIPKALDENKLHYEIYGFGGSAMFLLIPIMWDIIVYINPKFKRLSIEKQVIVIIGITIVISFIINSIYNKYNTYFESITDSTDSLDSTDTSYTSILFI